MKRGRVRGEEAFYVVLKVGDELERSGESGNFATQNGRAVILIFRDYFSYLSQHPLQVHHGGL